MLAKITQVCLNYNTSLGTTATVNDINEVANTEIISFSHPETLKKQYNNVLHVKTKRNILGRSYYYSADSALHEAERVLAKSDLVICHNVFGFHLQWTASICRKYAVQYWVVPHGSLDPYTFSYRKVRKRLWRLLAGDRLLAGAKKVIFSTNRECKKASMTVRYDQKEVISWPTDITEVPNKDEISNDVCKQYGLESGDKIILYIGRLHEMKRPLETIEAFSSVTSPNMHLFIVGPEDSYSAGRCKSHADDCHARNVHVTGPIYGEEKVRLLISSTVYISLSYRENYNYAFTEALSYGVPAILSPGNDLAEEVKSVGCAIVLETNEISEAADALETISQLGDRELMAMGDKGRKWVKENLSRETFAAKLEQLVVR